MARKSYKPVRYVVAPPGRMGTVQGVYALQHDGTAPSFGAITDFLAETPYVEHLDSAYPKIAPDGERWIVLNYEQHDHPGENYVNFKFYHVVQVGDFVVRLPSCRIAVIPATDFNYLFIQPKLLPKSCPGRKETKVGADAEAIGNLLI
jgi:hypothetical protein